MHVWGVKPCVLCVCVGLVCVVCWGCVCFLANDFWRDIQRWPPNWSTNSRVTQVTPIQRTASESAHQFTGSGSLFHPLGGRWRMARPETREPDQFDIGKSRDGWQHEVASRVEESFGMFSSPERSPGAGLALSCCPTCRSEVGFLHTTAGRPLPSVPLESTWLLRFHCWHAVLPAVLNSRIHRGCPFLIRARLQPPPHCFAFSLDKLSVSRSFPLHAFHPELSAPPDSKVP